MIIIISWPTPYLFINIIKNRNKINISSTKIVKGGLKYYDYLTDVAKPFFNKKVLIIGPESTGKTYLCKELARYFDAPYVEEYGRTYEEETIRKYKLRCTQWGVEDYEKIAQRQDEIINDISERPGHKLTFIDTDAMITEMFCQLYLKQTSYILKNTIFSQHFDLILYLDPVDTKWIDDGLRFMRNERSDVGKIIKNKLHHLGRQFIVVKNDEGYEKRFEKVKSLIKAQFNI
jgi:HTH-type transcriptional repressor of NAD biosynthesis genes